MSKDSYSVRNNPNQARKSGSLDQLKSDFIDLLNEDFKYYVSNDTRQSKLLIREMTGNKTHLLPIDKNIKKYTEEDLFDVIEFIHLNLMEGKESIESTIKALNVKYTFPYEKFPPMMNQILFFYKDSSFELSSEAKIVKKTVPDLKPLIDKKLPTSNDDSIDKTVKNKVHDAVSRFRNRKSDRTMKKDAVLHLSGALESLKEHSPKTIQKKDEGDLFHIMNSFSLRHTRKAQNDDYPDEYLDWMFYVFLSTIHLYLDLINSKNTEVTA